jgi:hypothetical protein
VAAYVVSLPMNVDEGQYYINIAHQLADILKFAAKTDDRVDKHM